MIRKAKEGKIEICADGEHVPTPGIRLFCEIYRSGFYIAEKCSKCGKSYPRKPTIDETIEWGQICKRKEIQD